MQWSELERPAEIERRWAELRRGEGENEGESAARALTLNLICRTADAADAEALAACMWALGPRHPARVFLVTPAASGVKLRVAADPHGSELVELAAPPERAASLVAPLLATDLPVVLLWRGHAPHASPEFREWVEMSDRVLVDTQRLQWSAAQLAALAQEVPPHAHLSDLAWTRLTPWRQLLCQGLETAAHGVQQIRRVTIVGGGGGSLAGQPHVGVAATLLAGWLAQQLQWSAQAKLGPEALCVQAPQGEAIELRFEPGAEPRLRQLTVEGEEGGMAVTIEHQGAQIALSVRRGGALVGHWAGATEDAERLRGEPETLCEELSIYGGDALYQQSLARGLELLARLDAEAA